ncbi:MAG: acyl carrier protein [Phycisphaerales bacterium]|nr:acyl carrier protein [Phycisphaerales bacterium]
MAMSRDEIFKSVQVVLAETLMVDEEEVLPESSLVKDLGAESIDFLDIVFRLEKKFGFKIQQGELFTENVMSDPKLVQDGRFTADGIEVLSQKMPHLNFTAFSADPRVDRLSELFTVRALMDFVERKLAAGGVPATN